MTTITRNKNYNGCNPTIVAAFEKGQDILCSVWDDEETSRAHRWIVMAYDGLYQDEQGVWWDEAAPVER